METKSPARRRFGSGGQYELDQFIGVRKHRRFLWFLRLGRPHLVPLAIQELSDTWFKPSPRL
jgi:hypothetical protein